MKVRFPRALRGAALALTLCVFLSYAAEPARARPAAQAGDPGLPSPQLGTLKDISLTMDGASLGAATAKEPKLDSLLADLADAAAAGGSLAAAPADIGVEMKDGRVQVLAAIDSARLAEARQAVAAAGGEVSSTSLDGALLQGFVPPASLRVLAASPAIFQLRRPDYASSSGELRAGQLNTEGVAASNAPAWHSANLRGAGVKVAVIDIGFEGYAGLLGSDLPANVVALNFADTGTVADGGPHGTACAEIVYDMAPGATIYLMRVASVLDLQQAVTYALQNGIKVISSSIGWYNVGPGDGTGFLASEVARARSAGIFWATAASNDREAHWGGIYSDTNGNNYHEFLGGAEINCFVFERGGDCAVLPAGQRIAAYLRWNNWTGSADQDYDLAIVRWNGGGWEIVSQGGDNTQDGAGGKVPTEFAVATTAGGNTSYGVVIKRYDASDAGVNFELFVPKFLSPRHIVTERSLSILADSPGAMTVAAVDVATPFRQESYSSEGPTNGPGGTQFGGILKPDIAAFANVNTRAYGTASGEKFNGTSSATPHVAGAAALVRGAVPGYTVDQVIAFLSSRAVDMDTVGKDNRYGSGRLWLGAPPGAQQVRRARLDFNGDGRADILWRHNASGANATWLMNGATASGVAIPALADQSWRLVGSADFNGDRRADLLWRHAVSGNNTIWLINGSSASGLSIGRASDPGWRVVGSGDFDADGRSEILWRHASSGANMIWFLNGSATTLVMLPTVGDLGWRIAGTGDFNADGRSEILWRHAVSGNNALWFVNGAVASSVAIGRASDPGWRIVGSGDFDADGRSDILWRHASSGANMIWFMSGSTVLRSVSLSSVSDSRWQIASDGDFNGDGRADILWRHSASGASAIWFMNGPTRVSVSGLSSVSDLRWGVVGNATIGTAISAGAFGEAEGATLAGAELPEPPGDGPALGEPADAATVLSMDDIVSPEMLAPVNGPPTNGVVGALPGEETRIYLPLLR